MPASSLEFSAALYSVGAEGLKATLIPGCEASKAGMIFSCQIGRSSLRQLSIVRFTSWAKAAPPATSVEPRSRVVSLMCIFLSLMVGQRPFPFLCAPRGSEVSGNWQVTDIEQKISAISTFS